MVIYSHFIAILLSRLDFKMQLSNFEHENRINLRAFFAKSHHYAMRTSKRTLSE